MGNDMCADGQPVSTHAIVQNLYNQHNDLLHIEIGRERMDFIETHHLEQHKHRDLNKYYFGKFVNGKAEGLGMFFVSKHQCYEGSFSNGLPQGFGTLTFLNRKERFEGQFQRGVAHGKGKLVSKCGDVEFTFQGIWKHSKVVSGKLTPQFGTTIEYMLINNEDKNNQFIQFSNGDTYKGALNAYLQPHGQGIHTFNPSSPMISYEGQWKKGYFQGWGVCKWRNGSQYVGEFGEGVKKGHGKYTYPSGKYYEGYWINGLPYGIGSHFNSSGNLETSGVWVDGSLVVHKQDATNQILECERLPVMKAQQIRLKNIKSIRSIREFEQA